MLEILLLIFNVMNYGAHGDGFHDDTLAINHTINSIPLSGGILYFPSGTYLVNSSNHRALQIFNDSVTVQGESKFNTKIKLANNSFRTVILSFHGKNEELRDVTLDSNYKNQTTYNYDLWLDRCDKCYIHDNYILNSRSDGIFLTNTTNTTISNNFINDTSTAIWIWRVQNNGLPQNNKILNNVISNVWEYSGIISTSSDNNLIQGNYISNVGENGIELTDSRYSIVTDNSINGFGNYSGGEGIGTGLYSIISNNYVNGKNPGTVCYESLSRPSITIIGFIEQNVSHELFSGNIGLNCDYGFYAVGNNNSKIVKFGQVENNQLSNMRIAKIGLNGVQNFTIIGNSGWNNTNNILFYNSNTNNTILNNN